MEDKTLLERLGASKKWAGYKYLTSAVEIFIESGTIFTQLSSGVYPKIARQYGTTVGNVERRMLYALKQINEERTPEYIEAFGKALGAGNKITLKGLILFLARKEKARRKANDEGDL